MRPILPKEVQDELNKMYHIIEPYMFYTKENGWALRPDAPQEIVEMKKKVEAFWIEVKRDSM